MSPFRIQIGYLSECVGNILWNSGVGKCEYCYIKDITQTQNICQSNYCHKWIVYVLNIRFLRQWYKPINNLFSDAQTRIFHAKYVCGMVCDFLAPCVMFIMLCTAQLGGPILKTPGRVQNAPFQLGDKSPKITDHGAHSRGLSKPIKGRDK